MPEIQSIYYIMRWCRLGNPANQDSKIMKFLILNREEISNFVSKEKYILISISSPGESEPVELPVDPNRTKDIIISFHDVTKETQIENLTFFNESRAKKILNFVNQYKNKINLIVCQCDAGISRSPAIAAALGKILNNDDSFIFDDKRYIPQYACL